MDVKAIRPWFDKQKTFFPGVQLPCYEILLFTNYIPDALEVGVGYVNDPRCSVYVEVVSLTISTA